MKITNNLNLPESLVEAAKVHTYQQEGEISVTSLIDSPRMTALALKHQEELSEDVADMVWAMFGTSIHALMDKVGDGGAVQEKRFGMMVNGWKVTGRPDYVNYGVGVLQDYKVTSAWTIVYGSRQSEWEAQLNCYNALASQGHSGMIRRLQVVAILRDWQRSKAKYDPKYPQHQLHVIEIPIWSKEEIEGFMLERVKKHQWAQEQLAQNRDEQQGLVLCSDSERWKSKDVWAVMKPGRKSAVKVCETEEEARNLENEHKEYSVVLRPGKPARCENYCRAAKFCEQFKKEQADGKKD